MPDPLPPDSPQPGTDPHPDPARRSWMGVLARADGAAIAERLSAWGKPPAYARLRGPETGLVMVRGRTGGGGAPFNLGEMTVTRCTIRTATGQVGHAYVAGRDAEQAELAALLDALLQDPAHERALQETVIQPLAAQQQARRDAVARKAEATRVQFFAMRTMRS